MYCRFTHKNVLGILGYASVVKGETDHMISNSIEQIPGTNIKQNKSLENVTVMLDELGKDYPALKNGKRDYPRCHLNS